MIVHTTYIDEILLSQLDCIVGWHIQLTLVVADASKNDSGLLLHSVHQPHKFKIIDQFLDKVPLLQQQRKCVEGWVLCKFLILMIHKTQPAT